MTGCPLADGSPRPPAEIYDVALSDLDGVIYRGERAIPHAAEAVAAAREAGMRFGFVTNNALRTPDEVAALLIATGVQADPAEVVTSAQAGAAVLAERLPAGSRVLACGGAGLVAAIRAAGLVPVDGGRSRRDGRRRGSEASHLSVNLPLSLVPSQEIRDPHPVSRCALWLR